MKTSLLLLFLAIVLIASGCEDRSPNPNSALRVAGARTFSSFDRPTLGEKITPAKAIAFDQAGLAQVLNLYAETSGRSVIRGGNLPEVKLTFSNQTPMASVEILQALDTVLAAQGITTVFLGSQYVKVVPEKDAIKEPGPVIELTPDQLPDSSSFLIYIVKVKRVIPSHVIPVLQPFAKLPGSIMAIDSMGGNAPPFRTGLASPPVSPGAEDEKLLILRDYSSNVRRMMQVLAKLEAE